MQLHVVRVRETSLHTGLDKCRNSPLSVQSFTHNHTNRAWSYKALQPINKDWGIILLRYWDPTGRRGAIFSMLVLGQASGG
jgi:hypothetical protein